MRTPLIRPSVTELRFRLDTRRFHPELFETLAYRRVQRADVTIQVRIIPSGHVLEWSRGDLVFTESLVSPQLELPETCRRMHFKCEGSCRGIHETPTVNHGVNGKVEVMNSAVLQQVHDELVADGLRRGLLVHLQPENRLGLTPLSYMTIEAFPKGLSVASFHTFPEELTVVRTQSLIEFLSDAPAELA